MKVYAFFRKLLRGLFIGLFRVEVSGTENIPADGPLLVCPNHLSNWDPIIIAAVADRQIRFMAKSSLFKIPLLNTLLKALGVFPVRRGAADTTALKTAIACLKSGDAVGMFPQGTRCIGVDPASTEIKHGVGMIAYRSGADVLPVSIKTKGYRIMPFRKVQITFGKVIPYGELGLVNGNNAEYHAAAEYIFGKIVGLL